MSKDYYSILEIDKNASEDEIKKSYKKLAKKYHPDLNKEEGAEAKFKDINAAYQVLGDSQKRQNYDQFGSEEGFAGGHAGFDGMDPFDIFNSVFNQDGSGFGNMFKNERNRTPKQEVRVHVSFIEAAKGKNCSINFQTKEICSDCKGTRAYKGDKKNISYCSACNGNGVETVQVRSLLGVFNTQKTCRKCQGSGKTIIKKCDKCNGDGYLRKNKTIKVKIPNGIKHGETLVYKDDESFDKQEIYIYVTVSASKVFQQREWDIYTKIIINPLIAILGGVAEVPTLYGISQIKIPAGTQFGAYLKLKKFGIKYEKSAGDLYVKVEFDILNLSKKEIELLKSIKITPSKQGKNIIDNAKKEINV